MSDGSGCDAGGHDCGLASGTSGDGPISGTGISDKVDSSAPTGLMINGAPVIETSHEFVVREAATPSKLSASVNGS